MRATQGFQNAAQKRIISPLLQAKGPVKAIWPLRLLDRFPLLRRLPAAFLGFGLKLKPDVIAALLLETSAQRKAKTEPPGIAVSDLTDDLLDPIVRLLRLLDRPEDISVLAPTIEREILWRLINGAQGAMVRQLGLADSRMTQIGRTIRWIRDHYAETVRIEDLANMAGMSLTSFHRHFLGVTSLSPLQFQKQIRLHEARSRLLSSSQDVAAIGPAYGQPLPSGTEGGVGQAAQAKFLHDPAGLGLPDLDAVRPAWAASCNETAVGADGGGTDHCLHRHRPAHRAGGVGGRVR